MRPSSELTELRRELASQAFEKWSKGDKEDLFSLIADEVVWHLAGSCPGGGTFHGKETFLEQSARPLHRRLARSPVPVIQRIVADADIVVVQWQGDGETAVGTRYHNEYCWVLRFSGDRIVEITSYLDTLAVARVYGEG